jgi:uncharacterized protein
MNTRETINLFLDSKKFAIAGVSRNTKKFGHIVYKTLKDKGYNVFPVNPNADLFDGNICYRSIEDLPADVKNLLVLTHKRDTETVIKKAIAKGIKNIWVQQGCETENAIQIASDSDINLVSKACILMYTEPKGFHKFHRAIARWTGSYHR